MQKTKTRRIGNRAYTLRKRYAQEEPFRVEIDASRSPLLRGLGRVLHILGRWSPRDTGRTDPLIHCAERLASDGREDEDAVQEPLSAAGEDLFALPAALACIERREATVASPRTELVAWLLEAAWARCEASRIFEDDPLQRTLISGSLCMCG